MANFRFKIVPCSRGNYRYRLTLEVLMEGNSAPHRMLVPGLMNPWDLKDWDQDNQCYVGDDIAAKHNNFVIKEMFARLEQLCEEGNFFDEKDLLTAYKKGMTLEQKKDPSFGELVKQIYEDEKNKPCKNSTNYQVYQTLYNKLTYKNPPKYEGRPIADIPVPQICDRHFVAFGQYVLKNLAGRGYRNLMTYFKAALNRADDYGIAHTTLKWDWKKSQPAKRENRLLTAKQRLSATATDIPTLSVEDFQKFVDFDTNLIAPSQQYRKKLVQLYKDTVLLMYYTKSRPADVIQWDWTHNYDPDSNLLIYTPHKLRNRSAMETVIYLCPEALEIVNKYKGQSKGGYLLPLPINEINWGLLDGKVFTTWEVRRKNTVQHINKWLGRIGKYLGLGVPDLTMYVFRHTAITHALNNGENVFEVAKSSGTSVEMIEKHYYNSIVK